jgi:hypothetical protein
VVQANEAVLAAIMAPARVNFVIVFIIPPKECLPTSGRKHTSGVFARGVPKADIENRPHFRMIFTKKTNKKIIFQK